ncbi:MAG: 1-deoxy-D-xylulose-5-phosphate reductoisomerase [Simkaniaceae bacterium]|nr:1-deoxy-D-xylulose-5-phosphate reductoisomerase [Simkaniaceae bacterium]
MQKKRIVILGSTGSIGRQTLEVVRHLKGAVEVVGLAAKRSEKLLMEQAREFGVKKTVLNDPNGLIDLVEDPSVDLVMCAMVGTEGIVPAVHAIKAGKDLAIANKELLVSAGHLITRLAREHRTMLIPVDSEHSALFQCMYGESERQVARLILTASGGPFRGYSRAELEKIGVEEALNHPTWQMGVKNTIDSATLMNKGLELIEAHWLFNQPLDKIDVVIHPQSVVHSMVEFVDGSMMAQMSTPSMHIPIQVALTYPARVQGFTPRFDFKQFSRLEFEEPDRKTFVCLKLAAEAIKSGGTLPCYMNAANEVLVEKFVQKKLNFVEIGDKLAELMATHKQGNGEDLKEILEVDKQARAEAQNI